MTTDMKSIPQTEAMLATATDIYVVVPITTKILGVEATVPLTAAIGTIDKLTRENTRSNMRRYSLGRHAFEPYDIIPGPITTSLTASKIVLYKDKYSFPASKQLEQLESLGINSSQIDQITESMETNGEFQGLFGLTGGNVLYQQKPIHIQVINYDHSSSDFETRGSKVGNPVTSITYYWNCWIDSNPISYNLQNASDILVKQDVKLTVGRVEVYEPNLSRMLSSTASSIIPTSISF